MLTAVLSLCYGITAWAAGGERPTSSATVTVRQGLLTVDVRDARLADVLHLIGERAGLQVSIDDAVGDLITAVFNDVPLDQGIRRLVRGNSLVLLYVSPKGSEGTPQLTEVRVYGAAPPGDHTPGRAELRADGEAAAKPMTPVRDPDPRVRAEAVAGLKEIGGEHAAWGLTAALRDDDPSVRLEAVRALSAVGGATARKALATELRKDPDPQVRLEAARTLAPFAGQEEVRRALNGAKSDQDGSMREAATSILVQWMKRNAARSVQPSGVLPGDRR
jgi:hypothetical protein